MAATTTIALEQIHCASCENTIRITLGRLEGIRAVEPDAATNTVAVAYDDAKVSEADIRARLTEIGFDPAAS
jgi:copper chaperone CopZ